ncbi:MAG: NAD-dependent epimerase/dehydratase family protein, partial [Oscillospiraceae bacterium]|nr:NAD-dependent epimerase/dehydratase family protein [Oscillospiraceae bacterium]
MKHNVLITGGAGKLGRFVADELRKEHNVTLFDVLAPDETPVPWETDLKFVKGDLTCLADCMRAITLAEADVIVHLGAIPNPTDQQPGKKT